MQGTHRISAQPARDHGGGPDAAIIRCGGWRQDWINPVPCPLPCLRATARLEAAS